MNIIIKPENKEKIEKALENVQGKCRLRLVNYDDIVSACIRCDAHLAVIGLESKASKDGVSVLADPCGIEATQKEKSNAFFHGYDLPMSTQVYLAYKGGSWRVKEIKRQESGNGSRYIFSFTENQKRRIIENLSYYTPGK